MLYMGLIAQEIGPSLLALIGALMLLNSAPQRSIWLSLYLNT